MIIRRLTFANRCTNKADAIVVFLGQYITIFALRLNAMRRFCIWSDSIDCRNARFELSRVPNRFSQLEFVRCSGRDHLGIQAHPRPMGIVIFSTARTDQI